MYFYKCDFPYVIAKFRVFVLVVAVSKLYKSKKIY